MVEPLDFKGKTIWIIEARKDNAELYTAVFTGQNANTRRFSHPFDAMDELDKIKKGESKAVKPDIILTDYSFSINPNLPGTAHFSPDSERDLGETLPNAGLELINHLARDKDEAIKNVPVILLTGNNRAQHLRYPGNVTFVLKPIMKVETLLATLHGKLFPEISGHAHG